MLLHVWRLRYYECIIQGQQFHQILHVLLFWHVSRVLPVFMLFFVILLVCFWCGVFLLFIIGCTSVFSCSQVLSDWMRLIFLGVWWFLLVFWDALFFAIGGDFWLVLFLMFVWSCIIPTGVVGCF